MLKHSFVFTIMFIFCFLRSILFQFPSQLFEYLETEYLPNCFRNFPAVLFYLTYTVASYGKTADEWAQVWVASSPSSGSSLAQVSAVIRLAMKRWLFWGLTQCWGATEEVMDMEEVMWGHVRTDPPEEEEEEEEDEEEVVGSRVVARCSFSGSTSMESRRTWAVLRGCRSFCTAAMRKTMECN